MTMTFTEWRRINSGTRADYENYVAGLATRVTRQDPPLDAGFSVFNGHVNGAFAAAKTIFLRHFGQEAWDTDIQPFEDQGIMSIFSAERTFTVNFYVVTIMLLVNGDVTADPEPASPVRRVLLRQAILAELAGTATGWSTRQLTRRIAQASPELADVRPAVVSRELESLRTDGYTQGTAYPPAPVCWTLTEAGRLATAGASTP